LAWEFSTRTMEFIRIAGTFTMADTFLSVIVECYTSVFFRSVCVLGKSSTHLKHMGVFEMATSFLGAIMIFLLIAAWYPPLFEPIFTLWLGIYTLFQSLLSCSVITSLGNVKNVILSKKENPTQIISKTKQ
jgi:hypothetical protein